MLFRSLKNWTFASIILMKVGWYVKQTSLFLYKTLKNSTFLRNKGSGPFLLLSPHTYSNALSSLCICLRNNWKIRLLLLFYTLPKGIVHIHILYYYTKRYLKREFKSCHPLPTLERTFLFTCITVVFTSFLLLTSKIKEFEEKIC